MQSIAEKFWARVTIGQPDDCWVWTKWTSRGGYGRFKIKGVKYMAHRVAYELTYGPIPAGKIIMHRCDNPPCCNPAHLQLGTHQENTQDMLQKGRNKRQAAHGEQSGRAKLTDVQVEEIRRIYPTTHLTQKELAQQYGVSDKTINDIAHHRYRTSKQPAMQITKRWNQRVRIAKLTDAQVLEIRSLAATGEYSQKYLAQQFGVDQSYISDIVRRKRRTKAQDGTPL